MQRIEYPKGSKVTIEDGVILIEPAEKWEPNVGEIVNIKYPNQIGYLTIFFSKNKAAAGINTEGNLYINTIVVYPSTPFSLPSEEDKTRLLTALPDAGYRYNAETREVEKIRLEPKLGYSYWTFMANGVCISNRTISPRIFRQNQTARQ